MSNRSLTKGSLDKDKQVRLTYDVPLSLRQEFKKKAIYDEKEMRQALMELMQGYVEGRFKLK